MKITAERRNDMVKTTLTTRLVRPTPKEDAAITAAAESDPDTVLLTDEEAREMRPFAEVHPDMVRQRGPQKAPTKVRVTIRLDRDVITHFKERAPTGWQSRVNSALRKVAGLD